MSEREEAMHRQLYRAHADLRSGGDHIHAVLVMLAADCRYAEDREKFFAAAALLSSARDCADKALDACTNARVEIIRTTGCDGGCESPASQRGT